MHRANFTGRQRLLLLAAVAWFCCGITAGCRKSAYERVAVSGQVTIDGTPLSVGNIRFIPAGGGRPSVAQIGSDGRFDFGKEGVVSGRQRIEVIASEQIGANGYRWHAPQKYASYLASGLERDITQPTNDLQLTLSWEGKKPFTVQGPAGDDNPKGRRGSR